MFETVAFWCAFAALFAASHLIAAEQIRLRVGVIAIVSFAAIVSVLQLDWRATFLVLLATSWVVVAVVRTKPNPKHGTMRTALLLAAPLLLFWAVGKVESANGRPLSWLFFAGSSFFLVKAFSLIRDRLDGKAGDVDPYIAAGYLLYFPTFLSGPMHYWGEFRETLLNPERPRGAEAVDIAFRFMWGLFKVRVLGALLAPMSLTVLSDAPVIALRDLMFGAIVYSLVLYFNFSGYVDMVIATSRAIGIRTPENFNWPYFSPSIRDFWRRWHITFSRALTAHIFIPLSRSLSKALPGRRLLVPAIGYMITFLFAGFWHGATANFLLWGAYHGLGLVAQDVWQKVRPKKINVQASGESPIALWTKIAVTFLFVSMGWIFFVLPIGQFSKIVWY